MMVAALNVEEHKKTNYLPSSGLVCTEALLPLLYSCQDFFCFAFVSAADTAVLIILTFPSNTK